MYRRWYSAIAYLNKNEQWLIISKDSHKSGGNDFDLNEIKMLYSRKNRFNASLYKTHWTIEQFISCSAN